MLGILIKISDIQKLSINVHPLVFELCFAENITSDPIFDPAKHIMIVISILSNFCAPFTWGCILRLLPPTLEVNASCGHFSRENDGLKQIWPEQELCTSNMRVLWDFCHFFLTFQYDTMSLVLFRNSYRRKDVINSHNLLEAAPLIQL